MKKYFISCVCFLAVVNLIILSCTTNDSAPDANSVGPPSVITTPASLINMTTATSGGVLVAGGGGTILSRGICYSTSPNPTIADTRIVKPGSLGTFVCAMTGLIAGTQYHVRAYATNIVGTTYGEDITFTTTTTAIALPVVTTTPATAITETSVATGGNVTSTGGSALTVRGVCWATAPNPTTLDNVINDSAATTGTYSSLIIGLSPNTTYYVRAFATNTGGIGYGDQITFTTAGTTQVGSPVVTTTDASSITQTSASSGGNVTSDGGFPITARGICWATNDTPTILDNVITATGTTGSFTSAITGLTANTIYYVRAFATNSTGTAYGAQIIFTTATTTTTGPTEGNAVCNGTQPTAVVQITSSTGKIWMDRNLGASQAATSSKDYRSYGCLYQWGRGNDGHASIVWTMGEEDAWGTVPGTAVNGITQVHSSTDTPGNALFVTDDQGIYDWRDPQNDNLWQGVSGINNPCPTGFRIPTRAEYMSEIAAYTINGPTAAFTSIHKFPVAGERAFDSAVIRGQGDEIFLWTSTIDFNDTFAIYIALGEVYNNFEGHRSGGYSVRCIKN